MNNIITPQLVEQLGVELKCSTCRPEEIIKGKKALKGQMCPQCGNHFDEFGNHNKMRAYKWLYVVFQDAGFQLNESQVESLYLTARFKVSQNEASYMETIQVALKALKTGGRLPE